MDRSGQPLATLSELAQSFGSVEAAALHQNALACDLEDRLVMAANYIQQQSEGIEYLGGREQAMSQLLTDPSMLATYYLELERTVGELPPPGSQQQQQQFVDPQQLQFLQQQQLQQQQFGVRPEFPGGAPQISVGDKLQMLQQAPAINKWRVMDQLSADDVRNIRIVF